MIMKINLNFKVLLKYDYDERKSISILDIIFNLPFLPISIYLILDEHTGQPIMLMRQGMEFYPLNLSI